MTTLNEEQSSDSARHRIFFRQPKRVPSFDTAFINASHKEGMKLLLSAAPEHCQIIVFTNGIGAAYAMKRLFKRNFHLNSFALQYDLRTLTFTGQVAYQFVCGGSVRDPLSRYFCAGDSYLHEMGQSTPGSEDVIDMFCLGQKFHDALAKRGRGRSLVFAEEQ